jgi:hypothetical protein
VENGLLAALIMLGSGLLGLLCIIGFVRYAASKGYGPLVIILLLITPVIGFLLVLLLPDRKPS